MTGPATSPAAVDAVVANYRFAPHSRRHRGRLGSRRGVGGGSTQEFLEFRDYAPGDDLRHVDWRGFARTDQLRVRQFEAEVAPWCDLVVDTSASMAVTPGKAAAARALVAAMHALARAEQSGCRVQAMGAGPIEPDALQFAGALPPVAPALPLRLAGIRVLLTDGLWPTSPGPLVHALAAGAAWFLCVQLLDPWEASPPVGEVVQLVDVETGERAERRLDAATVAGYHERLQRLGAELQGRVVESGGVFVRAVADELATMFTRDLLPAGAVEPA